MPSGAELSAPALRVGGAARIGGLILHNGEHGELQHHQREQAPRRSDALGPMRSLVGAHGDGPNVNAAGVFQVDVRLVRAVEAEEAAPAARRARVDANGYFPSSRGRTRRKEFRTKFARRSELPKFYAPSRNRLLLASSPCTKLDKPVSNR